MSIKKLIQVAALLTVLSQTAACTNTSPAMIDYSYVPTTHEFTVMTSSGLEDL